MATSSKRGGGISVGRENLGHCLPALPFTKSILIVRTVKDGNDRTERGNRTTTVVKARTIHFGAVLCKQGAAK